VCFDNGDKDGNVCGTHCVGIHVICRELKTLTEGEGEGTNEDYLNKLHAHLTRSL